ncbi:gluconate 2-dehydrogenase subunit 3 family protein [Fodinibius salsisoli]|uniref:Gluconate 2-dehydrogenase subunit 3 family protein n=1 Tax=Fodinibius salsisoli TaxID=2820877 RepID=A0ABT3PKQ1_9BACT|nr:gluconate 2-dehydrogenase subunit 3 family protein [Fodinibius salsisoli]MCW9706487.1 gluconate 2-dehydrogenase subunit 3 family protein [Fodinibius salsisoli]
MDRREAIKTLSLSTLATSFVMTGCQQAPKEATKEHNFWKHVSQEDIEKWETQFFTDHEFETVRQLANLIIPADERSGNAEDAGVPEFIDFMMLDRPENQTPMRGGLSWLDVQCQKQFDKKFIDCSEEEQKNMLDQIAYPKIAEPEMQPGVTFFNSFRDLVASGFWSSQIGIEDIGYMGNQPYDWQGCSHEALEHIGLADKAKNSA